MKEIVRAKPKDKLYLLGNEAVVRGALEAGVSVAATYPGTPSSEIGDLFYEIRDDIEVYFEFSVNEKVALEVAASGSVSGLRSFAWMKHVGLNVASDSFMSLAYTGIRGGLVILSADDPSMFSSQNEQDNRWYARLGNAILMEPSNPQEMLDIMPYAFEISEKFKLPVLLRTTTRVSHMRGVVEVHEINSAPKKGHFEKDPQRLVPLPANSYVAHKRISETLSEAKKFSSNSIWNKIFDLGGSIGIITSGVSFNYVMDILKDYNLKAKVLKLGFSYPFPEELILKFVEEVSEVIIVEEVDPIMEKEVLSIFGKNYINKPVHGKLDGTLPMIYEYNPDIIKTAFEKVLKIEIPKEKGIEIEIKPPMRPPVFCPGCPHRGLYDAVKRAVKKLEIDAIFPSDIGCYTLGFQPPFKSADYVLSMGSSIGTGSGFGKITDQKVISFIGDSTFFHAGIPALVNAVHQKSNLTVIILDNRITAMTGGQPNPGIEQENKKQISIEKIVKALDVDFIKIVDPYNLKATEEAIIEALNTKGVSVIITNRPCILISEKSKFYFFVEQDKCTGCKICIYEIACPAMYTEKDGKVVIDPQMCTGCAVCVQTCPEKAIVPKRREI